MTPEAVALLELHDELVRSIYVDLEHAEKLCAKVERKAAELRDDHSRAVFLRCQGHIHFARGRHPDAVSSYYLALELLGEAGRDIEIARTLTSALQPLIYLSRYDEAYSAAARAKIIFARHGDRLRLARLGSNIGNILYRQDRYSEALQQYEDAGAELREVGEAKDVAAVLSNSAVCCISLSRFGKALEYYREARSFSERNGLLPLAAAADYNIAYLHYLRGEYVQAIALYGTCREHCETVADFFHAALCDLDEGEMYLELNLTRESAELLRRAAAGFERLRMPYEQAKALAGLGIAEGRMGETARAFRASREARDIFLRENNAVWPALIDLHHAELFRRTGRARRALSLCAKAQAALAASGLYGKAALCDLLGAQLHLQADDPVQARTLCLRAREHSLHHDSPALRIHTQLLLGQIEEALGSRTSAWEAWQKARAEMEGVWGLLRSEGLRISFLTDKLSVYENLVALCLQQERGLEEAFLYMQRAKSRSMADLVASQAPGWPGIPPRIEDQMEEMLREVNAAHRQSEAAELSGKPSRSAAAHNMESSLLRMISESGSLDMAGAESPGVDQIRSTIPEDAALLEYYQVRGRMYVAVIDRKTLRIAPLAGAALVRQRMRLLQFQISKLRLGPAYVNDFGEVMRLAAQSHLRELYEALIAPIRPFLRGRHLIVAPHDFLHHLPFHALHDGEQFLCDLYSISYAPSASVFALCRGRRSAFREESLVFGIPDDRSPHIEAEATAVANLLPSAKLLTGKEATLDALRRLGPGSRYIHIATHGLFRRDNPMFSSVRLGDGNLSVFDLYRTPLPAELITLSGCGTGLNVIVGGDELLGMMRGLLRGGAQSLLVSLWDVNDRSTGELMAAFYGHVRSGSGKARALQAAMAELRQRYPHPYYWAPFALVGDYEK
jgi:tetratricopeptide (TPR) repeat protein